MRQKAQEATDVFAYCVKCGARALDKCEERAFRCRQCGYQFFHNCAAAVAGLIECDGGLLVTVRKGAPKKGTFDLPGGFIEYRENAEDALRREIAEELSLEICNLEYVGSYPNQYPFSGVLVHTIDLVFRCQPVDLAQGWTAQDDVASALIVSTSELKPSDFGLGSIRRIIMDYLSGMI